MSEPNRDNHRNAGPNAVDFVIVASLRWHYLFMKAIRQHFGCRLASAAVLALLLAPSRQAAAAGSSLTYRATDDCPNEATFLRSVESRGGFMEQTSAIAVAIDMRRQDEGWVGRLELRAHDAGDSASAPTVREVRGKSCDEVSDALAIVTALAFGEGGSARQKERAAAEDAHPPTPEGPKPEPFLENPRKLSGHSDLSRDVIDVEAGQLSLDPQLVWTAFYGVSAGQIPSVVAQNLDISFHFADFVTLPGGSQRVVGPILWLRLGVSAPGSNHRSGDVSTFIDTQSAALGVCVSPHYNTHGLVLLGCLESGINFMGLKTTASDGSTVQSKTVGYGTAGPLLSAEYNLGAWLHVAAKFSVNTILGQASAERADGSELFHSRSWSLVGAMGVGVHF